MSIPLPLLPASIHTGLVAYTQKILDKPYPEYRVCSRVPNPRPEKLVYVKQMNSEDVNAVMNTDSYMFQVQSRDRSEAQKVATILSGLLANLCRTRLGDVYVHDSRIINWPYFMDNPQLDQVQQYIFGIKYIVSKLVTH